MNTAAENSHFLVNSCVGGVTSIEIETEDLHVIAPCLNHSPRSNSKCIGLAKSGKMAFKAPIAVHLNFSWSSWTKKSVSHQGVGDGHRSVHGSNHGFLWAWFGILLGNLKDTPWQTLIFFQDHSILKKKSSKSWYNVGTCYHFLMDIISTTVRCSKLKLYFTQMTAGGCSFNFFEIQSSRTGILMPVYSLLSTFK